MKNFLTYGQLESILMRISGVGQSDIDPGMRKAHINTKLFKMYSLFEGQNDRQYNRTATLTLVANVADVSALYLKEIVRVYDSSGDISILTDSKQFSSLVDDPFMDKSAACYHFGDSIKFFFGRAVNGSVMMEYRGKPIPYTEATIGDGVDVPPEFNQQLIDECLALFMKDVPSEVQDRLNGYAAAYDALGKRTGEKESKREKRE